MAIHEQPMLYSVDLRECTAISTLAPETVAAAFAQALEDAGATVVQALSHNFDGAGLTCILILAESHAVLHAWPETGAVNIDIFSCSTKLKSLTAIAELGRSFGAALPDAAAAPVFLVHAFYQLLLGAVSVITASS